MGTRNVFRTIIVEILSISVYLSVPAPLSASGKQESTPDVPKLEPATISLSVTETGQMRVDGKAPLYAEMFVFDKKTGIANVAEGPELNTVGGYPVPIRITSLGYGFSGTISAVYKNVIFNCEQLPPKHRVIFLASVYVQKGFSYDAKINSAGCSDVFVTTHHYVLPGKDGSLKKKAFVDLRVTAKEVGEGEEKGKRVPKALVTIQRQTGQKRSAFTDENGIVNFALSDVKENVVWLEVAHPQNRLRVKYPIPVTLRGAQAGLVIYDIPVAFESK